MKKLLYVVLLGLAITACGKKSAPAPPSTPTVSGKFKLVQNSDTLYKNDNIANGVIEIINQNAGGDTSYLNPATPQLVVTPNVIAGYDPITAMTDTLNFTTTSTGVEITPFGSPKFNYDLSTNFFYSGIADGTISIKLYKLNATTVKLVISQVDGLYIGSRRAKIFVKP
jgi:hypothetical protein